MSKACIKYNDSSTVIYGDQIDLQNATLLCSNSGCTTAAALGYYSDGIDYYYWNGSTLSFVDSCP